MSGPPRRKSVPPPAPPPSFDDERPTPIATAASAATTTTTTTQTQTEMELAPEPPTILAISITAPTFKSSDQVPAARIPMAGPDVAVTGPYAKTHIREGEGRTVLDMPKVTPPVPAPGKVTAPSFTEAARSGPFSRTTSGRVGDSETVSERIQIPPGDTTLPPGPAPVPLPLPAPKAAPVPLPPPRATPRPPVPSVPDRKALDRKPTEVTDPWEYSGEVPAQAASLSNDYESGGVELDTSGRLVAPGMKRRKGGTSEVSEISAPADLLSAALDVWPDEPPPPPAAPPRVEPVGAVAPEPPPPEPDTAPRAPPPPRRAPPPARAPSRKRPSVAHADTVLRAPGSRSQLDAEPEVDPEEQFFREEPSESGVVTEDPSAGDPVPTPTPVREPPPRSNPRRLTSDEERYGLEDDYAPDESAAGPTNVNEPMDEEEPVYDERFDDEQGERYEEEEPYDDRFDDDPNATGRRGFAPPPTRRRGSPWPMRLFLVMLLGVGFGGAWLWATGQWESVLRWFGLR
ncbi:MAG TPA: hypothetical protein VFA20_35405 [Myxococcaceae bacterium]|nr:hypothetical protein [Myxococcaceae bacterium]